MATPSRAQDPTAAALSAIEEALNLGDPAAEEKAAADQAAGRAAETAGTQAEGEAPLAAGVQLPKARTTPIDDWSAPIAVMTEMTENTPIVIPIIVRPERNLFAPNDCIAIAMISRNRIALIYS